MTAEEGGRGAEFIKVVWGTCFTLESIASPALPALASSGFGFSICGKDEEEEEAEAIAVADEGPFGC